MRHLHLPGPTLYFTLLLICICASCSKQDIDSDTSQTRSILNEYDKSWLQSGRDRILFHDPISKNRHLDKGWKLDENSQKSRFPWPRFTKHGGTLNINWLQRMERRIIVQLVNVNLSYPDDFVKIKLNGHPLSQMTDPLPLGNYEFYLPAAFQVSGNNKLEIHLSSEGLVKDEDFNKIGLHSIRVTLGAVVKNSIRIGDQVRDSLLFAPPVAIDIPYTSGQKHFLEFSYGLYSIGKDDSPQQYSLELRVTNFEKNREFFTKNVTISTKDNSRKKWKFTKINLPAITEKGVLELRFVSKQTDLPTIDYLAVSEVFLKPIKKVWSLNSKTPEPDILFITLSSIGASQLGCYGNPHSYTPVLDRFSQNGLQHLDVSSASNGESESLVSMATGKYPRDHGYFRKHRALNSEIRTLPELFLNSSLGTHAFIFSEPDTQHCFSLMSGFRRVYLTDSHQSDFDSIHHQFLNSLNSPYLQSNPGFFWTHLAPKLKNTPQTAFPKTHYAEQAIPISLLNLPRSDQNRLTHFLGSNSSVEDLRELLALNDQRLYEIDCFINDLCKLLTTKRSKRKTITMITAAHGVLLSPDSNALSSDSLSQEIIHVPLILTGLDGTRIEENRLLENPISTTRISDLLISVARTFNLRGVSSILNQSSMMGTAANPIFSEHATRPIIAFRKGQYKLIHSFSDPYFQIATTNLFDLVNDPGESVNLYGKKPELTRQYLDPVTAFSRGNRFYPEPRSGLEDEVIDILKSLNYTDINQP